VELLPPATIVREKKSTARSSHINESLTYNSDVQKDRAALDKVQRVPALTPRL
jgi:hypothetical protein